MPIARNGANYGRNLTIVLRFRPYQTELSHSVSILHGFGEMDFRHVVDSGKVGDRASYLEDSIEHAA